MAEAPLLDAPVLDGLRLDDLLRQRFGFPAFRPGQRQAIQALLTYNAALAVFPTGGGKSLCYQLPALALDGLTLVVSPLVALMKDQIDDLRRRGIPAARLDASLGLDAVRDVAVGLRDGSLKLLYVAPERFNNERFLQQIGQVRVSLFAVDEAHCISEWGHNFRPDYLKLAEQARALGAERVLALTATATPAVVADICAGFSIPPQAAVVTGFYRPNLTLLATPVPASARDALLLARLRERPPGPTIVYVTLQRTAERVAALLAQAGLPARAYHAGMETDERSAVQDWWAASDQAIVVATIAFGMGIDKANVRAVYHLNLPKSLESYSQEVGRAGRDGAPATVELFASPEDLPILDAFAYGDTPTLAAVDGVVREVLEAGERFDVSLYDLSTRHDIRQLVLRTLLTYLELAGVLRQGTPFYAAYEVRPLLSVDEIVARFAGERATFVAGIFQQAKQGRVWYAVQTDAVCQALGHDRQRVVAALDYLVERGWAEVRAADLRQRFTRLQADRDPASLAADLLARFEAREQREVQRTRQVLDLVTHDGCQVNALVGYFGEMRDAPCGHCTHCLTGTAQRLPPLPSLPAPESRVERADLAALAAQHPDALGEPRQRARFLCGLSSPRLTQARLGRHRLFGALEGYAFPSVLAWCAEPEPDAA